MLLNSCNSSSKEGKNKPIFFRKGYKNQQISSSLKIILSVKFHPGLISVQITSANVLTCKRLINDSRNVATLWEIFRSKFQNLTIWACTVTDVREQTNASNVEDNVPMCLCYLILINNYSPKWRWIVQNDLNIER